MNILCSDLEGVFLPEIWINVAQKTGIEGLRLTTRDISDYDVLMKKRLSILKEHDLKLADIQAVISELEPLDGALECLDEIRSKYQIIIVSDTFTQFVGPLMEKLKRPTLFCNSLEIGADGSVTGYSVRQKEGKKMTAMALKGLNYRVAAFGDSYNDIGMLKVADAACFFRPPEKLVDEYPGFPVNHTYEALWAWIKEVLP